MKVAVFGGTGFIGYSFVRQLLEVSGIELVVYCTSASGLSNLARHDVEFRLAPYSHLPGLELDLDTDFLVNFAHPFGARDGLAVGQQVSILGRFLGRQLRARRQLRVIHISSMSIYEPFRNGHRLNEDPLVAPPRSDQYAYGKYRIERELGGATSHLSRLLILRPTIVYGPYCRPWTDNLLAAFAAGDVCVHDLGGRIQPLFARDLSRFLVDRLTDFRSGIFNVAGPEEIKWSQFFSFFQEIVGRGECVRASTPASATTTPVVASIRTLLRQLLRDRHVKEIGTRLLRRLPASVEGAVRSRFGAPDYRRLSRVETCPQHHLYCTPYYSTDRLVSTDRLASAFPDFTPCGLEAAADLLRDYYRYRFTDAALA